MRIFGLIDPEHILSTWGYPTLVLAVVGLIIWKAVWPRVVQYLDDQRAVANEARKALTDRAAKLEEREETLLGQFKETLDGLKDTLVEVGKRSEAQVHLLEQVADGIKTLKRTPTKSRRKT